jgi:hypothetical protein
VAVAGFVHVHVHGVFVPYTRRREARAQSRAQSRARSQSVTIAGFGGRAVSGAGGPPVAAPDLYRAARLGVLLEPVVDPVGLENTIRVDDLCLSVAAWGGKAAM